MALIDFDSVVLEGDYELLPHQKRCLEWMFGMEELLNKRECGMKGGMLSLEMGLGKTLTMLAYLNLTNKKPNLVICSKTVVDVWRRDIAKFYGNRVNYIVLHKELGSLDYTEDDLKSVDIVITTYDTILRTASDYEFYKDMFEEDMFKRVAGIYNRDKPWNFHEILDLDPRLALFTIQWENIVYDESQRVANPKSKTFYSCMCLSCNRTWCLSGTPIRNYSSDLYAQFRLCGLEWRNKKEFTTSVFLHGKEIKNDWQVSYTTPLNKYVLTMNYAEAHIELPPIDVRKVEYDMDEKQLQVYETCARIARNVLSDFLQKLISYSSVLEMFLRLRQICDAPYIFAKSKMKTDAIRCAFAECGVMVGSKESVEEMEKKLVDVMKEQGEEKKKIDQVIRVNRETRKWLMARKGTSGLQSSKINKTIEILRELHGKTVVFTCFREYSSLLLDRINIEFGDVALCVDGEVTGEERNNILETFRKSEDKSVLIITYKVGSEGLNLFEAENVILSENWWNASLLEQAKARVHRYGQTKRVQLIKLVPKSTIEEKMENVCQRKIGMVREFFRGKDVGLSRAVVRELFSM